MASTLLDEIGIDASKHKPRTLEELEEWEGLNFDLIVSLSPEAHHAALELTRTHRGRGGILADARSDHHPGLARAGARRLSQHPRRPDVPHPPAAQAELTQKP